MDLSALLRASDALNSSLGRLGFWLAFFTSLVVVGLIVEYRHEVIEFWHEVRMPMAAFPWTKFMGLFGGLLVTIGVAGELGIQFFASGVESALRANSQQIEGVLNKKAQ
jgi:hypothetical protein